VTRKEQSASLQEVDEKTKDFNAPNKSGSSPGTFGVHALENQFGIDSHERNIS
jgi:hypothetical protein